MSGRVEVIEGAVFAVRYPFVRETYQSIGEDGYVDILSWRPGTTCENTWDGDVDYGADGEGWQRLTVVGVYQPPRFPTRVFYTRDWVNPDGIAFGKRSLQICTREKFKRLIAGYKFHYELNRADAPVAALPETPAA
ncbi:hypothetical protein [Sphingomonas albertensis]|uniref:Uncharacterized protein n=1 Tax=Sphingomonas albertensis TaxID=2762591 RepID=A0ABR7ASB2_9SPHN|nr:hypothetical protein [Sphingomonas albertensis]MBC3943325.1 hypothetical protein [Sphingomonas albertensis]